MNGSQLIRFTEHAGILQGAAKVIPDHVLMVVSWAQEGIRDPAFEQLLFEFVMMVHSYRSIVGVDRREIHDVLDTYKIHSAIMNSNCQLYRLSNVAGCYLL